MTHAGDGPDPRLAILLRIKEARQDQSRQVLDKALHVENQRRAAEQQAQSHHVHCAAIADEYVHRRFEAAGQVRDVGRFFQSLAIGNYNARRDASRAQLVIERVSYRRGLATQERETAAKNFLANRRTTDGLERLLEEQNAAAEIREDIRADDEIQEIYTAGRTHGTA